MNDRLPDHLDSVARTRVYLNGTEIRARRGVNFIGDVSIADNPTTECVDITINVGTPKSWATGFTVKTNYFHMQYARMALTSTARATLQGNANLIISDDFKNRQRIVLA